MLLGLFILSVILVFGSGSDIKPLRDVVRGFGYDLETHTVLTSDGYQLTVHRLLRGSHGQDTAPTDGPAPPADAPATPASDVDYGVPVLLVEGVLQSSATKLALGNDIAYSLADQGFDVWLSNYRGNMYSRRHETLSPDQPAFWNFTLHELGTEDLPAVIDYVLRATHREKLIYLGYSMGTTIFWILTSSLPAYQNKVAAMVAIGPVARPSNMMVVKNFVLRGLLRTVFEKMWTANMFEVLPYGEKFSSTINWICTEKIGFVCKFFIKSFNYIRKQGMKIDSTFKIIPYSPAGISTKVLIHFIQIVETGQFRQFDHGVKDNQVMYNSKQPPEYDLKKISLPVYFVHSDKDRVATPHDVEWLAQQLPRRPERRIESVNNFRHIDFTLNKDLDNLLTRPLTSLITELAEEHRASLARVTGDFPVNDEAQP